jgi:hypothetical protein
MFLANEDPDIDGEALAIDIDLNMLIAFYVL